MIDTFYKSFSVGERLTTCENIAYELEATTFNIRFKDVDEAPISVIALASRVWWR